MTVVLLNGERHTFDVGSQNVRLVESWLRGTGGVLRLNADTGTVLIPVQAVAWIEHPEAF
jgi:hypothetical protein